jgi:D-alanyl-D-alanine carboxypeptidase
VLRAIALAGGLAAACASGACAQAVVGAQAVAAPLPDALRSRIQAKLDSLLQANAFPGATLGVVLADGRASGFATGLADTSRHTPMTPAARMPAGSVGKTYVAAVAMQLVNEGRLKLDAPIGDYLGGEPWFDRLPNGRSSTVRMLMNHTTGLARWEFDPRVMQVLTNEPDKVWTPAERITYVLDAPAPFEAGKGWSYADTNYILLAMIIERITGAELNAEIARRELVPLGLENTVPSDRRRIPGLVQGYAGPENEFGGRDAMLEDGVFAFNPQMEWAGGGYATTAEDLAKWAKALYEGRAVSPGMLAETLRGVPARGLGTGASYGLGVIIKPTSAGTSWGHSGFFPGYITEMMYFPDTRIALAIQFNTSVGRSIGRNTGAFLAGIAAMLAGETSAR